MIFFSLFSSKYYLVNIESFREEETLYQLFISPRFIGYDNIWLRKNIFWFLILEEIWWKMLQQSFSSCKSEMLLFFFS